MNAKVLLTLVATYLAICQAAASSSSGSQFMMRSVAPHLDGAVRLLSNSCMEIADEFQTLESLVDLGPADAELARYDVDRFSRFAERLASRHLSASYSAMSTIFGAREGEALGGMVIARIDVADEKFPKIKEKAESYLEKLNGMLVQCKGLAVKLERKIDGAERGDFRIEHWKAMDSKLETVSKAISGKIFLMSLAFEELAKNERNAAQQSMPSPDCARFGRMMQPPTTEGRSGNQLMKKFGASSDESAFGGRHVLHSEAQKSAVFGGGTAANRDTQRPHWTSARKASTGDRTAASEVGQVLQDEIAKARAAQNPSSMSFRDEPISGQNSALAASQVLRDGIAKPSQVDQILQDEIAKARAAQNPSGRSFRDEPISGQSTASDASQVLRDGIAKPSQVAQVLQDEIAKARAAQNPSGRSFRDEPISGQNAASDASQVLREEIARLRNSKNSFSNSR